MNTKEKALKTAGLKLSLLLLFAIIIAVGPVSLAKAAASFELVPVEAHHVMRLNSDQPYVAGYHVNTEDLEKREVNNSTAITASFPSTDPSFFPSGSWLAGGMFVQAQDNRYIHVDYGFYTMLVVDSDGNLFIDLGLHQTYEFSLPSNSPLARVIYAYTWQIQGVSLATPVTLQANWDADGNVTYTITIQSENTTLVSVNVPSMEGCDRIIRKFYAGNAYVLPFPFTRFANYFQFGVTSSEPITNKHWTVHLKEPQVSRKTGWFIVDRAWSTQGDQSYLDMDWMWGGSPYNGVDAQYYQNPLENPYEILFSYTGHTLTPGTVFWEPLGTFSETQANSNVHNILVESASMLLLSGIAVGLAVAILVKMRKRSSSVRNNVE
jgi:hypothetical protein